MSKNLPSRAVKGLAFLIESYGYCPDEIANNIGLDPKVLYQSDMLIEDVVFNDVLEEAAQVCNERYLGLKLASHHGWEGLGSLWFLLRSAKTLRQMLDLIATSIENYSQAISAYLVDSGEEVSFCIEVRRVRREPVHDSRIQVIELCLAVCCEEIRKLLGKAWQPNYVQLRQDADSDIEPLKKVFGERLYFNQDANALTLSKGDVDRLLPKVRSFDTAMIESALAAMAQENVPFDLRVDKVIRLLVGSARECSAQIVAEAMSMKLRTLQHRLKQSESSYQLLYDKVRFDMACDYLLMSGLSVAEIAERLFFPDTPAFSHFFSKQTGASPRAFRNRNGTYQVGD